MRYLVTLLILLCCCATAQAQTDQICVTSPSQTQNYNQLCMAASVNGGSLALTNQGSATGGLTITQDGSSILAGVDQNIPNQQSSNYTIQNTDCGKTITAAGGLFTITLPSVSGFPSNCSVLIKNADTTRGKKLSGFPSDVSKQLWPLQSLGAKIVGSSWESFYVPGRWMIPSAQQFYIDNVLGSDTNDGLATGASAFASWAGFFTAVLNEIDEQGFQINVQLAASETWSNFLALGIPVGSGTIELDLNGNTLTGTGGNSALTVDSAANGGNLGNAMLLVRNGTITCSGGGNGLTVVGGVAGIADGITMGACSGGAHFLVDSPLARIIAPFNYTITGGAASHWVANNGGHSDFDSAITVTISGTPSFSSCFAKAFNNAMVISSVAFSGSASGVTYCGSVGGTFATGCRPTAFPGNAAGFAVSGSVYDCPGTPTVTGCGTSPGTPLGTDTSGNVVEGSSATGCTVNFTSSNAPVACSVAISNATAAAALIVSSLSSSSLTVSHPSVSGASFYWTCFPKN